MLCEPKIDGQVFKLSEKSSKLLSDDMCIDLEDLRAKIESPEISPHSSLVCEVIETLCSFVGEKTADEVNGYCYTLIGDMESEPDFVLDSIRMAFYRFISGGLRDLFVYQENEAWYPKIILAKVLYPNDIDLLDDEFLIFRGCEVSEFESKKFGQSWSTSEDVASKFAFKHYDTQDWFELERRILVRAKYRKCDTLYSDQTECGEFEIVVKPEMPSDIKKIT